jgi:hypothetical protein
LKFGHTPPLYQARSWRWPSTEAGAASAGNLKDQFGARIVDETPQPRELGIQGRYDGREAVERLLAAVAGD